METPHPAAALLPASRRRPVAAIDTDGTLWTIVNGFGTAQIATVDKTTGHATVVGAPIGTQMISLEIAGDGTMYGIGYNNGRLYRIDKTTGVGTAIGSGTGNSATMNLAFDCSGQLWATTGGNLWTVNTTTGTSTARSSISGVTGGGSMVMGLTFDHACHMLATTYSSPGSLYSIDPSTGVATGIGSTGLNHPHGGSIGTFSGAPVNTSAPSISGTAQDGQTLTASPGLWSSSPTSYGYQWYDCDAATAGSAGSNCAAISGATSSTHTLTSGDVGHSIEVGVTATNGAGTSSAADSTVTADASAATPANTTAPMVSGTAQDTQVLTVTNGSWSGSTPQTYSYQWEDCGTSGGSCSAISGATGQSYTLRGSDVGHTVRVVETASNSGGSGQAVSAPTGTVAPPSPTDLSIGTSGAVSRSGSTVDPGITLSCPAGGPACSAIETVTVLIGAANTPTGSAAHVVHPMTVGSASFTIPAGGSVQAIFQLKQLGMTLLSDHKHLQLQIDVSGQATAQTPITATKTIGLGGRFATYTMPSIKTQPDGTITLRVNASAPGQVNVLITAWQDNIAGAARLTNPADRRFVVARGSATATKAGVLSLTVRPNAKGRRLLAHPAYRVTLGLWVSYIPLYAFQTDTGYYNLHPATGCSRCQKRVWPPTR
jgi:hypothetical protein